LMYCQLQAQLLALSSNRRLLHHLASYLEYIVHSSFVVCLAWFRTVRYSHMLVLRSDSKDINKRTRQSAVCKVWQEATA
jgi:hypothetical protein